MSITTLTMNPAVDVSTTLDRIVPKQKLRCAPARRDAGGGGINVARVVARMGGDIRAIFPIGGPPGDLLRRLVQEEVAACETIAIAQETRENFSVEERASGQQYRFVLPGPALSPAEQDECLAALESLTSQPAFLVASGSLPAETNASFLAAIVRSAKAKGSKVVVDTSGPALAAALGEGVFLAKPNLRELEELVGSELADKTAWLRACRDLVERAGAEIIALTLGPGGAVLVTRTRALHAPALPVEAVSEIGAGDSFVGAMVWALDSGRSIIDAFRYGMAAGAAALLSPGTELCRREDVERLVKDVLVEET